VISGGFGGEGPSSPIDRSPINFRTNCLQACRLQVSCALGRPGLACCTRLPGAPVRLLGATDRAPQAGPPLSLGRAAVYAWPLLSPRAKRSRWGVPAGAPPQPGLQGRGNATKGPVACCRAAHSLRPKGVRLCSGFLGSPPCVRRLQGFLRACVLGAGARFYFRGSRAMSCSSLSAASVLNRLNHKVLTCRHSV
jgi:hypothetical protein